MSCKMMDRACMLRQNKLSKSSWSVYTGISTDECMLCPQGAEIMRKHGKEPLRIVRKKRPVWIPPDRYCKIKGCPNLFYAKKRCKKHYREWYYKQKGG